MPYYNHIQLIAGMKHLRSLVALLAFSSAKLFLVELVNTIIINVHC